MALDVHGPDEVRAAYERMSAALGDAMVPAVVQRMAASGVDVRVATHQQPLYGAVISVGLGGSAAQANLRAVGAGPPVDRRRRRPPDRHVTAGAPARRAGTSGGERPAGPARAGGVGGRAPPRAGRPGAQPRPRRRRRRGHHRGRARVAPATWTPPRRPTRSGAWRTGWVSRMGGRRASDGAGRYAEAVDLQHGLGVARCTVVGLGPPVRVVDLGQVRKATATSPARRRSRGRAPRAPERSPSVRPPASSGRSSSPMPSTEAADQLSAAAGARPQDLGLVAVALVAHAPGPRRVALGLADGGQVENVAPRRSADRTWSLGDGCPGTAADHPVVSASMPTCAAPSVVV